MLNLYVRDDAELIGATVDGERIDTPAPAMWTDGLPPSHFEHGKKVWSATLQIPPGDTHSFDVKYRVPGVLQTEEDRKVYRLHVQHQPKVRPETLIVRLRLPDGAEAVKARGWRRDGDLLVWERPVKTDLILEVSWRQ